MMKNARLAKKTKKETANVNEKEIIVVTVLILHGQFYNSH